MTIDFRKQEMAAIIFSLRMKHNPMLLHSSAPCSSQLAMPLYLFSAPSASPRAFHHPWEAIVEKGEE